MKDFNYDSKPPVRVYYGISAINLLQIAFIILRLCKVINWNWWLVLLPTIIPVGLIILVSILSVLIAVLRSGD